MSVRLAVCCGLAALAIPVAGNAQADTGEAVRNWTSITECGAISDNQRRLACMDNVLARAGIGTPQASGPQPPLARAEPTMPPTTPQAQGQAQAARQPQAQPPRSSASGPREEVSTTIASVRTVGYQKLSVTTAEGAVWEQTEAETFNTQPKAGDAFSVEPGAMNSFRCRFNQASRYRCRPVN